MKKRVILGIISLILITVISVVIYYNVSLNAKGTNEEVVLTIDPGTSTLKIIDLLKEKGLIKSDLVVKAYIKMNNITNIQAGNYALNKNMNIPEIFDYLTNGKVVNDSVTITFVEGKRLKDYVKQISSKFNFTEQEINTKLKDSEFLQTVINKYDFITDEILNKDIINPLEGYLFPDTYEFDKDSTIEDIIFKMLDTMSLVIKKYSAEKNENFTIHELLTLASVVEIESAFDEDRSNVASVLYNRLSVGMTLGCDATTYYVPGLDFGDNIGPYLNDCNAYNTRGTCVKGLPVGPIASPSIISLEAAFKPVESEYYYFVSDKNRKMYFAKNLAEHNQIINQLKSQNLW